MAFLPLARDAGRIHVCGHRGHSVGAPENTLPALTKAAQLGATVAEIDVVLTQDDAIVLLHDEILDRTTDGTGRVMVHSLAAIRRFDAGGWFGPDFAGTEVPTLQEALATAREAGMGLLVEIKERQRAETMIDGLGSLIAEENAADDVLVISFDHPSLVRLRQRFPLVRTELITHARHVDPVGLARSASAASVAIEWDMFHADDAAALHEAGVAVRVTVPRPDRMARREAAGFDDRRRILDALGRGLIDVIAGDDVAYLTRLVRDASLDALTDSSEG